MAFFTPFATTSTVFSPAFAMLEDLDVPTFESVAFEAEPVAFVGPFATSRPRRQNLRHSASHGIFGHSHNHSYSPYACGQQQQLAHQEYLRQRQQQQLQQQRQRAEQLRLKQQREREMEMQRRKAQAEREARMLKLAQEKKMQYKEHLQPKFDVRETADAYQLHGELAGLNKKDVELEFVDAQTLVVRGRIVRDYGATPAAKDEEKSEEHEQEHERDTEMEVEAETDKAKTETEAETDKAEPEVQEPARTVSPAPSNYQKATVEDSPDEDDRFTITSMTPSRSTSSSRSGSVAGEKRPAATTTAAAAAATTAAAPAQKKTKTDHAKYLAQERVVGEFERVFRFPHLISQKQVHASLEDGVLNVVVPKMRAEQRRVIWF